MPSVATLRVAHSLSSSFGVKVRPHLKYQLQLFLSPVSYGLFQISTVLVELAIKQMIVTTNRFQNEYCTTLEKLCARQRTLVSYIKGLQLFFSIFLQWKKIYDICM